MFESLTSTGDFLILSGIATLVDFLCSNNYGGMLMRRPKFCQVVLRDMFYVVEQQRDLDVCNATLAILLSELRSDPHGSLKQNMVDSTASETIDNLMVRCFILTPLFFLSRICSTDNCAR